MALSKELPRIVQHANTMIPKRLILSYITDWVFIAYVPTYPLPTHPPPQPIPAHTKPQVQTNKSFPRGIALIGYGFSRTDPTHTPFSLTDASISYPHTKHETVTTSVMVVVSLIAPGVLIALLSLLLIPGSSAVPPASSAATRWRYKIWEWHAGWLGLALAAAGVFMATEGLKDLYGRPRPDLLARCDPDLEKIETYAVGGLGRVLPGAPTLVSWGICRNRSKALVKDGFVSFPSGHASCEYFYLSFFSSFFLSLFSGGWLIWLYVGSV